MHLLAHDPQQPAYSPRAWIVKTWWDVTLYLANFNGYTGQYFWLTHIWMNSAVTVGLFWNPDHIQPTVSFHPVKRPMMTENSEMETETQLQRSPSNMSITPVSKASYILHSHVSLADNCFGPRWNNNYPCKITSGRNLNLSPQWCEGFTQSVLLTR